MQKWRTIKLLLSKGVRIPNWMKWLSSVEVGYERVNGKRIRYIKFRRADAAFGQLGSVWLSLPEFRESLRYFPGTFQIRDGRSRVLNQNLFFCSRCFALSGRTLGEAVPVKGHPYRMKADFACTNEGCTEKWTREW